MHSKTLPCEPCPQFASICLRHLVLRQQDRNHNKQIYLYDTLKSCPQPSFCLFFLTSTISYSVHPLYLFFFFSLVVLFASFLLCAALSVVPLRHKAKGSRPSEWASRQMPDGAVGAYRAPMGAVTKLRLWVWRVQSEVFVATNTQTKGVVLRRHLQNFFWTLGSEIIAGSRICYGVEQLCPQFWSLMYRLCCRTYSILLRSSFFVLSLPLGKSMWGLS